MPGASGTKQGARGHTSAFSVVYCCDVVSVLDPCPPIVARLDIWGTQYISQKAHVFGWFADQDTLGYGAYSRQQGNTSVRRAYNRLLNPGMLIWIAGALGADEGLIEKAAEAAIEAEKQDYRKRCAAFRAVIPFDTVSELLKHPEKWVFNPAMESVCSMDGNLPIIEGNQDDKYFEILEEEELA